MHTYSRAFVGLVTAVCLTLAGAAPVAAQSAPVGPDRIDLVGLVTRQPTPGSPTNQVQFHVTANYKLQSAPEGFVLLFLFENSADDSTQQSSNGIPVKTGSGQLELDIDYVLKQDVRTLTLVAGLFKGEQKLVAWVSTNPIDMGPWPGRVSFEKAMAARLNNDLTGAEASLGQAIIDAPATGNYYYWRGDTRIRLEHFADAAVDFSRSIELMPQDRASRVGRGIARLWLGESQGAVEDLSFAIDATGTPDRITAWAYRARGLAHAALGDTAGAVSDYQAYLTLSPDANDRALVQNWISELS
jgi:tetratricopeptide (TPR) repeat protein